MCLDILVVSPYISRLKWNLGPVFGQHDGNQNRPAEGVSGYNLSLVAFVLRCVIGD